MKTKILFLIMLSLIGLSACKSSADGQQKKNAKEVPAELAKAFKEDAARLAVRELITGSQTGELGADIPQARIDYFYDLLTQIYWMGQNDEAVPDVSSIRTFPRPNLQHVMVVLDKDSEFKTNWSKGVTTTSNLYLNQMISKYRLSIKNYRESTLGPTLIMESPMFINTTELGFLLKNIESIKHAEADGMIGGGDNITWGSDSKNAMALKFSVGEGDCQSGCIHRKEWVFYVSPTGEINYMGARGKVPSGKVLEKE